MLGRVIGLGIKKAAGNAAADKRRFGGGFTI